MGQQKQGIVTLDYTNDVAGPVSQVLQTTDENGDTVATYLWGNELAPLMQEDAEDNPYYYITDHLDSVTMLLDQEGKKRANYSYDEFGAPHGEAAPYSHPHAEKEVSSVRMMV